MKIRKVGILTSGGDCPGLNAIIRAVVKCSTRKGWQVYGIPYGTDGFMHLQQGRYRPEDLQLQVHGYEIPGLLHGLDVLQFLSGSVLGSLSKGHPEDPAVAQAILLGYEKLGLDALIAVGGDGSLHIIYDLAQQGGWNFIAIPKTIDNDVPFTETAVGFDTAVNTVTRCLYDLTFTAASHDRVMVVQVMGRDAGHLALHSGIAGGADVILIPELVPQLTSTIVDEICRYIAAIRNEGRKFALVVLAEGVRDLAGQKDKLIGETLAALVQAHSRELCATGQTDFCELDQVDSRATVLGHVQRSGSPTSFDRLLATSMGKKAVDLIADGKFNQLVVWQNGQAQTRDLNEVIDHIKQCHSQGLCPDPVKPDSIMVQTAQALGIYIGI